MENKQLHYFKCIDCLTPVSTYDRNATLACDCGGSSFEYMGRVEKDETVKDEERCKCNALCTFAAGPKCNCRCCGANHGLGMLAYETVSVTTGKAILGVKVKDKARDHAVWYREMKAKIAARDEIFGDYAQAVRESKLGKNMSWDDYRVVVRLNFLMKELVKARTFKKRETLAKTISEVSKKKATGDQPVAV